MDAGAIVYFSIIKDFAHVAGVYEVDDWMKIDVRADRFRPLLNDEFGRDFLGEIVGFVSLPSQQLHEYAMMRHNDRPVRYLSHVPYAVLTAGGGEGPGPIAEGVSQLGDKRDRYVTTAGALTLGEYNARAQAFRPAQMAEPYRFLWDTSVKYRPQASEVDALYRLEQEMSRLLRGRGTGLSRADIEALREKGE